MTDAFDPEYEFEKDTFNLIQTDKFRKFLVENRVAVTVVGFVVANNLVRLIDSLFDNIIFVNEETKRKNIKNNISIMDSIYYFKITIFKYQITIKNSQIFLEIFYNSSNNNHFYKTVLGSFIYDLSIKYSSSKVLITSVRIHL